MPDVDFRYILLGGLAIALLVAAFTDIRRRQIDNWLNAAIVVGAPVFWWASGLSLWPGVAIQIGLALGYGVPAKPAQPDRGITLRDVFGREILTVVADAATEAAATAALQAMATEGMTVDRTQLRAILRSRAWWWLHFFETLQPNNPEITP